MDSYAILRSSMQQLLQALTVNTPAATVTATAAACLESMMMKILSNFLVVIRIMFIMKTHLISAGRAATMRSYDGWVHRPCVAAITAISMMSIYYSMRSMLSYSFEVASVSS